MKRYLTTTLAVLLILSIAIPSFATTGTITLPAVTINDDPNTTHVLYSGPMPVVDETCVVTAVGNNDSVNDKNDLVLETGGSQTWFRNVERTAGATTTVGDAPIVPGATGTVTLHLGNDPGFSHPHWYSAGYELIFECEPPVTTTTEPPATTTTEPPVTTTTTTTVLVASAEATIGGNCLVGIDNTFTNTGDLPIVVLSGTMSRPHDPDFSLHWSGPVEPGEKLQASYLGEFFGVPGEPITIGKTAGLIFAGDYTLTVETLDHGTFTDLLTLTLDDEECKDAPVPEPPTTTTVEVPETTVTVVTDPPPEEEPVCIDANGKEHPDANQDGINDDTGELCRLADTGFEVSHAGMLAGVFLLIGASLLGWNANRRARLHEV